MTGGRQTVIQPLRTSIAADCEFVSGTYNCHNSKVVVHETKKEMQIGTTAAEKGTLRL